MSSTNNPLRQYFRRPAIYLILPSGYKNYSDDVITLTENGELPVFPMTAIDDITTKTPDALFNGEAVAQLIRSCIPNIKNPWKIINDDFDAIMIAIKIASQGANLEINSSCPSCNQEGKYDLNLSSVLSQLRASDYSNILKINELDIKFKPLVYKEMNQAANGQFQAQKLLMNLQEQTSSADEELLSKKSKEAVEFLTNLTMEMLAKTIEYIKTPDILVNEYEYILDFLKNCDKKDYIKIRDFNVSLKSNSILKPLDIKCVNCGHEYKQNYTLNSSDFFE